MSVRSLTAAVALSALVTTAAATAQDGRLRERFRERMGGNVQADRATGGDKFSYGTDPAQALTLWKPAAAAKPAPLIVFVHGGGWKRGSADNATGQAKVTHFTGAGYAFASIDYRLVPAATVEQQAADVAAAVAYLRRDAGRLGVDPNRIILMGHSAGAHLVALVGTDPRYLTAAGLSLGDLGGVIALDGAAYDVPTQLAQAGRFMRGTYEQAFGTDPKRQRELSPTAQAAAPNAPAFLLLHVDRADGIAQNKALADALRAAGTSVTVEQVAGQGLQGHMAINRSLGNADYPATALVDRWLAARR